MRSLSRFAERSNSFFFFDKNFILTLNIQSSSL
jgi:hypothetical protein